MMVTSLKASIKTYCPVLCVDTLRSNYNLLNNSVHFWSSTHISVGKVIVTVIKPTQTLSRFSKNSSGNGQIRVFQNSGDSVDHTQICSEIIYQCLFHDLEIYV